jgi:hypothetical protein
MLASRAREKSDVSVQYTCRRRFGKRLYTDPDKDPRDVYALPDKAATPRSADLSVIFAAQ